MVFVVYNLPLDLNVLVWQENNAVYSRKLTRFYKLLAVENKTCKIQLPNSSTNFRITTVKLYLHKHPYTKILPFYDLADSKLDLVQSTKEDTNVNNGDNINAAKLFLRNPACTHRL